MYKGMSIAIQINDIIGVNSKNNPHLVEYIDDTRILLIKPGATLERAIDNGSIVQEEDLVIESLHILSRTGGGYAAGHGLVLGQWVVFVTNTVSMTAEITNTYADTDMIELKIIPGDLVVYIDFEYKGLPEYIESIKRIEYQPETSDDIVFGDEITLYEEGMDEGVSLSVQTREMLNVLLQSIPDAKRTVQKMHDIHTTIQRYTELRQGYSLLNDNKQIIGAKYFGEDFRPTVDYVMGNHYVGWLIPTIRVRRKLYSILQNDEVNTISPTRENNVVMAMATNPSNADQLSFVNPFVDPDEPPPDDRTVSTRMIGFATGTHGVNHTLLVENNSPTIHVLAQPDVINVVWYNRLPEETVEYYNAYLPGTDIITKSNLDQESRNYWEAFNRFRDVVDQVSVYEDYRAHITSLVPSTVSVLDESTDTTVVSFTHVLKLLRPYKVERQHITKPVFVRMCAMLKKNIKYNLCHLNAKTIEFKKLLYSYQRKPDLPPSILPQMIRKSKFKGEIEDYYNLTATSSEIMNNILRVDCAQVFMTLMSLMTVTTQSFTPSRLPTVVNETCEPYNKQLKYASEEELGSATDGTYAIVGSNPPTYFKREEGRWVKSSVSAMECDRDLKRSPKDLEEIYARANLDPECSTNASCIPFSNKCESVENTKFKMKQAMLDTMASEFANTRKIVEQTRHATLVKKLDDLMRRLPIMKQMRLKEDLRYNTVYNGIASLFEDIDIIESPYAKHCDAILGDEDTPTKQGHIILFVDKFTRKPTSTEDQHWLYCKKTSVKLFPAFKYELAKVSVQGGNYAAKLAEICGSFGDESDGNIVHRFTGHIIKPVDFSEGFGYREDIEDEFEVDVDKEPPAEIKKKKRAEKRTGEKLAFFMDQLGIALNEADRNHIVAFIRNEKESEMTYFMAGYLLLYVQIKGMRPSKSVLNCKKTSFQGNDGLKYMACVVKQLFKEEEYLKKEKVEDVTKKIESAIKRIVAEDVTVALDRNRAAEAAVDASEPYQLNWNTFLPPLTNVSVKFVPLAPSGRNVLTLSGNIVMASMAIVQGVQSVMDSYKVPLLKTSLNVPFTSNVCCDEEKPVDVYTFLTKKQTDIDHYNQIVRALSQEINTLREYSTPSYLFDGTNTARVLSKASETFSDKIIEEGYIALCKYNTDTPLFDKELVEVCGDIKVDKSQPMMGQVEELKHKNPLVNLGTFIRLLNTVNRKAADRQPATPSVTRSEIKPIEDARINDVNAIDKIMKGLMEVIQRKTRAAPSSVIAVFMNHIVKCMDDYENGWKFTPSDIYLLVDFVKNVYYIFPEMVKNKIKDRGDTQLIPPYLSPVTNHMKLETLLDKYVGSLYDLPQNLPQSDPNMFKNILLSNENTGFYLYMMVLEQFASILSTEDLQLDSAVKIINSFITIFNMDHMLIHLDENKIMSLNATIAREERKTFTDHAKSLLKSERNLYNLRKIHKQGPIFSRSYKTAPTDDTAVGDPDDRVEPAENDPVEGDSDEEEDLLYRQSNRLDGDGNGDEDEGIED